MLGKNYFLYWETSNNQHRTSNNQIFSLRTFTGCWVFDVFTFQKRPGGPVERPARGRSQQSLHNG